MAKGRPSAKQIAARKRNFAIFILSGMQAQLLRIEGDLPDAKDRVHEVQVSIRSLKDHIKVNL